MLINDTTITTSNVTDNVNNIVKYLVSSISGAIFICSFTIIGIIFPIVTYYLYRKENMKKKNSINVIRMNEIEKRIKNYENENENNNNEEIEKTL
jgi:predicted PurR-regulated permease PerM